MMDFGIALAHLKAGSKIARKGWNGKGMFVKGQFPDEHSKMSQPYIYIKGAKGQVLPWTPSQEDLFAEDWEVI